MKPIHFIVAAIAIAAASAASAQTTTYTSSAAFLPNVAAGSFTNTFSGTPPGIGVTSLSFSGGVYSYTVSSPGGLYGNGEFLGTNVPNEALTITFTGAPVRALGGNFYATDIGDLFQTVPITLTLSNGSTTTFTPGSVAGSYRGFTTTAAITSLTIGAPGPGFYVGMDNFTVGAVIPEPGTWLLMALGVAGMLLARRRQAAV